MDHATLAMNAMQLVTPGKGILAADESTGTCTRRFEALGVESTAETRANYRNMLFATEGASEFISGAILYDETFRQMTSQGMPIPMFLEQNGIFPGIKVDTGAKPLAGFPGEKITEGLDGLRERCLEYAALGAKFTKWRAVITIGDGIPTPFCIEANAHALARYAALAQEAGLVPIVEPEVLMDGAHDQKRCYEVTGDALRAVFNALHEHKVFLGGMLLKPNMVCSGKDASDRADIQAVAQSTVGVLSEHVPASVPGIVFLSGGQTPLEATAHLDAMNKLGSAPWALSYSYGRALQQPALQAWAANQDDWASAQKQLWARAKANSAASTGQWSQDVEAAVYA